MRNNKKKGFTLVELLVVIAILAILATVSVVGYTSFIKSAEISNDQNLASQLNNFLVALKADSNGDFYNADVTPENVWAVTDEIRDLGGLDEITPTALKYGHLYFRFDKDENGNYVGGEYVFVEDGDVINKSGMHYLMKAFADDTPLKPGFFEDDDDNLYFLIDTVGSDIADVVRGFYTLDKYDDLKTFLTEAEAMTGDYSNVAFWAKNTVFVTADGNYVVDLNVNHSHLVVYEDAKHIGNTKYNLNNNFENISDTDPLLTITEKTTITIPAGVKLPANSLTINAADGLVTVVIEENSWSSEVKDNIDANFTKDNIVVNLGGRNYKINGNEIFVAETYGNEGVSYVDLLKYNNPMLTFDIMANAVTNKVTDSIKEGFVAWDVTDGKFTVKVTNAKGNPETPDDPISITDVIWSVGADSTAYLKVVDEVNGVFQLLNTDKSAPAIDKLTIVATPKIGADGTLTGTKTPQNYTVKLVRATGISGLTLGGKEVDFENVVALLNGIKGNDDKVTNSSFSLGETNVKIHFNHSAAEGTIVLDDATLALEENTTFDVSDDGKSLTLVSTLSDLLEEKSITLKIGKYFTKEISISMFNQYLLTFWENTDNTQIKLVGDENAVLTLGDLFKYNDDMELPDDAQVWFSAAFGGTSELPGDIDMTTYSDSRHGTTITTLNSAWNTTTLQFNAGTNNSEQAPEVNVAIVVPTEDGGYRRISAVRTIKVVDGWNITTGQYSVLKEKSNAGSSVVLLGNVDMDEANGYFAIKSGATFYGNCFTLDVSENGYMGGVESIGSNGNIGYGIIALSGNIQDTKIIGKVYGTFAGSANDKFGTNLIGAVNGATITNCYISNTRAPLVVHGGGTVTVEDTVIFGGRYANVDIRKGELLIKGNVTTVQQVVQGLDKDNKTVNVIGVGIAGWFEDQAHAVTVSSGANLKQYNFLDSSLSGTLPALSFSGVELMKLSDAFTALFTDTYKPYRFGDNYNYVNSGIVAIDKYHLNYSVTSAILEEWNLLVVQYGRYSYTVKLKTTVGNDEVFTIVYDSDTYNCTSTTVEAGTNFVKVTGATLKTGVVFEQKERVVKILGLDTHLFDFYVTSPDYAALTVDNLNNYVQVNYPYAMGGIFEVGGSVIDFHNKGMHYKVMDFDVWTPDRNNAQHKETFNEYLNLGDTYKPNVFKLTPSVE